MGGLLSGAPTGADATVVGGAVELGFAALLASECDPQESSCHLPALEGVKRHPSPTHATPFRGQAQVPAPADAGLSGFGLVSSTVSEQPIHGLAEPFWQGFDSQIVRPLPEETELEKDRRISASSPVALYPACVAQPPGVSPVAQEVSLTVGDPDAAAAACAGAGDGQLTPAGLARSSRGRLTLDGFSTSEEESDSRYPGPSVSAGHVLEHERLSPVGSEIPGAAKQVNSSQEHRPSKPGSDPASTLGAGCASAGHEAQAPSARGAFPLDGPLAAEMDTAQSSQDLSPAGRNGHGMQPRPLNSLRILDSTPQAGGSESQLESQALQTAGVLLRSPGPPDSIGFGNPSGFDRGSGQSSAPSSPSAFGVRRPEQVGGVEVRDPQQAPGRSRSSPGKGSSLGASMDLVRKPWVEFPPRRGGGSGVGDPVPTLQNASGLRPGGEALAVHDLIPAVVPPVLPVGATPQPAPPHLPFSPNREASKGPAQNLVQREYQNPTSGLMSGLKPEPMEGPMPGLAGPVKDLGPPTREVVGSLVHPATEKEAAAVIVPRHESPAAPKRRTEARPRDQDAPSEATLSEEHVLQPRPMVHDSSIDLPVAGPVDPMESAPVRPSKVGRGRPVREVRGSVPAAQQTPSTDEAAPESGVLRSGGAKSVAEQSASRPRQDSMGDGRPSSTTRNSVRVPDELAIRGGGVTHLRPDVLGNHETEVKSEPQRSPEVMVRTDVAGANSLPRRMEIETLGQGRLQLTLTQQGNDLRIDALEIGNALSGTEAGWHDLQRRLENAGIVLGPLEPGPQSGGFSGDRNPGDPRHAACYEDGMSFSGQQDHPSDPATRKPTPLIVGETRQMPVLTESVVTRSSTVRGPVREWWA